MSKCPYCYIDYNSSDSYNAHVLNCGFKNNPIPDPEIDNKSDNNAYYEVLKSFKVDELKKIANDKGINVDGLKKDEIISKLTEAVPDPNADKEKTGD